MGGVAVLTRNRALLFLSVPWLCWEAGCYMTEAFVQNGEVEQGQRKEFNPRDG